MNLIPPISANPMAPLPGNGLEPGDNPLAGIEGPIFYDEFIAALAKGAGGEGGLDLSGSSGEGVTPEGGSPESDLQGLPLEVTNQLVDHANFSPLAPKLVAPPVDIVGASSDIGSSAVSSSIVGSPVPTDLGSIQVGLAVPQAKIDTESAEAISSPKPAAAVSIPAPSTIPAPDTKVSTSESPDSGVKPAIAASTVVKADDAQVLPGARYNRGADPNLGNLGPQQSVSARTADSLEAAPFVPVAARPVQEPRSSASNDLAGQRLSIPLEAPTSPVLIQAISPDFGDEASQAVSVLNPSTRVSGSIEAVSDPSALRNAAAPNLSNVIDSSSVEPTFGPRVTAIPQTIDSGVPTTALPGLEWRGPTPSIPVADKVSLVSDPVGDGGSSDLALDSSMISMGTQTSSISDDFGEWRFKVRPNSANPVENIELPSDVSLQPDQIAVAIVKKSSDPLTNAGVAPIDEIAMSFEPELRRDPTMRSISRDVESDLAPADVSRTVSDKSEPEAVTLSGPADIKAPASSSKIDLVAIKPDYVAASIPSDSGSGSSNSISEKFVSTLLGISGLQPESAADRTAIEFRSARTLTAAPHMARWDAAAVQVELVRLVRDGGGQIVMKLTPPDEGSFRIDLSVDADRGVRIFVDGASDSVRTRLEQGTDQLREQFSQMGFNLQLDMNSRRETSGQHGGFGFSEAGDLGDRGDETNNSGTLRANDADSPPGRRRSPVDESRVYFRA
jgi:hypothetical protein